MSQANNSFITLPEPTAQHKFKAGLIDFGNWQKSICNLNPLRVNPTKCSNTLKQFVSNLPKNCFSVFDHFERLALKGLTSEIKSFM